MRCLDQASRTAKDNLGMIDKTESERQAIKAARKDFAEALNALGLMAPFFNRSPADIDLLIEACVDGFRASMMGQQFPKRDVFDDEIPF
jgi:hypothetical protein